MNEFIERYKTLSNSDLFRVIENQSDYQAKAVQAAKLEIEKRNLSEHDVSKAKDELEAERENRKKNNDKRTEVEQKIKTYGTLILNMIDPIQKTSPKAERLIGLITIVFGVIAIVKWFNGFELVRIMLVDNTGGWDLSMVEYFLPLILLPLAIILFWFRKKSGWVLMASYLTYSAISTLGLIIMTWKMESSNIPAFDSLFPQTSPTTQSLTILFYGGTLWVLTQNKIKGKYYINRKTTTATIGIVSLLTILFILPSLLM